MRIGIEWCVNNLAAGSHKAMETLKKDPNMDHVEYGCLSHCGICRSSPFALVEHKSISGSTPNELVEHIYLYIDEIE